MAAVLVMAVAASLLASVFWAQHYQPLEDGSGWHGGGRVPDGDGIRLSPDKEITNIMGTEYLVTEPKPGDRVGLVIPVSNTGRYPVRIVGVDMPFGRYYVTDVRGYHSKDLSTGGAPFVRFRPFTLGPGQTRGLAVTARLVACRSGYRPTLPPERGSTSTSARHVPVTYRFLGFTATTVIPLDYALTLRNPPQCA